MAVKGSRKLSPEAFEQVKEEYLAGASARQLGFKHGCSGSTIVAMLHAEGVQTRPKKMADLTGRVFGKLTVLGLSEKQPKKGAKWDCICECGGTSQPESSSLLRVKDATVSCGCYRRAKNVTHGLSKTPRVRMLLSARCRAKKKNLPFDIEIEDIVIPDFCPVLGIPLKSAVGSVGPKDDSPSLDKFIPELGYVKGNVSVISFKANSMKQNATLAEVKKLYEYMKRNSGDN